MPLSAFTHFESGTAPLAINHQGQFPVVTISFNLAPGAALGRPSKAIEQTRKELGMPPSIQAAFQGTAEAFQASLANEPLLILAALVTVYIVLGVCTRATFIRSRFSPRCLRPAWARSWRCCSAASDLSVVALIGIILLIGIVKKNAIMMIDFALDAERNEGKTPVDAIYQACLLRFRPIMMTTMAALLGGRAAGARYRDRIGAAPALWVSRSSAACSSASSSPCTRRRSSTLAFDRLGHATTLNVPRAANDGRGARCQWSEP